MCTLVVFKNVFPGYPLVVAANRDELFSRPSAGPAIKDGPIRTLAPADLQRGGTWAAVNSRGVFVALTNRKGVPSLRGLRSRGELVADAAAQPTAAHALASVVNREAGEHNACHMVIDDGKEGYVIVGNGAGGDEEGGGRIAPGFSWAPLLDGLTIVTNLGLGPGSPRGNAIMRAWEQLRARGLPPPTPGLFRKMLTLHDGEQPNVGPLGRRYASTCLHPTREDPDYGTVSSCVIRRSTTYGASPAVWHYWHGARRRAAASCCAVSWSDMITLPISQE